MTVIGWDVSTSAIGVCIRDGGGTRFHVIFPEGKTHLEKHRDAAGQVKDYFDSLKIVGPVTHVIEERLGGFTGGLTTKQTLMALAAMNAVISYVLSDRGTVVHVAPVTAKRITGLQVPEGSTKKEAVVKLVRSREPSFPYFETKAGNWKKGVDDMADAWLLAEAGLKLASGEATIGRQKKVSRGNRKARSAKGPGTQEG